MVNYRGRESGCETAEAFVDPGRLSSASRRPGLG